MDFYEKLSTKATSTQKHIKNSVENFKRFNKEWITNENLYDVIQVWINYRHKQGIQPSVIRHDFTNLKHYLYHLGFRLYEQDIREKLSFPTQFEEEKHPLGLDEILRIFEVISYKKKALYLVLISSGMRIGETCKIRKKDIVLSLKRPMIKIPAKITKTKRGRTTFISSEAWSLLQPKYTKLSDDDLLFKNRSDSESVLFNKYCKKAGLDQKYESGINKITLHSFRAYFITKIARYDENLSKILSGQKGYLLQYDRLTDEEKLESYLEFEKELLIYDTTRLKQDLAKAKSEKITMEVMQETIKDVVEIKEQIKKILEQKTNIAQHTNGQ